MQGYFIKSTKITPSVYFNPSRGLLDLRGKSSPENPLNFYNHIYGSLDKYANSANDTLTINAAFEYFNTSSSKCLYGMFKRIDLLNKQGKSVSVNWYFEDGDEDMMEAGEDLSFLFGYDFNFVEIPEIKVLGEQNNTAAA